MTERAETVALLLCLWWFCSAVFGLVVSPLLAVVLGVGLAAGCVWRARQSIITSGLLALLAPFGVTLPALALLAVLSRMGVPTPGFNTIEIAVFLFAYIVFLASAFGTVPIDTYRYGYAPKAVAIMVVIVCVYALVTGNWVLALIAVTSHAAWAYGIGSSNWFDHILHVLLLPVAFAALISPLI